MGFILKCFINCVRHLDIKIRDQVLLQLTVLGAVMLGFFYVLPLGSLYHDPASFSSIQEKIKTCEEMGLTVTLVGDINARIGERIPLSSSTSDTHRFAYPYITDPVRVTNNNGALLQAICIEEQLLTVNDLNIDNRHFQCKLTYKKAGVLESMLNYRAVSSSMVNRVTGSDILLDMSLLSNHPPLALKLNRPTSKTLVPKYQSKFLGRSCRTIFKCEIT